MTAPTPTCPIDRLAGFTTALILLAVFVSPAAAADPLRDAKDRLAHTAGAPVVVSAKRGAGNASFVRRRDRGPLTPTVGRATPERTAADFVARHADLFGLADASLQLGPSTTRRDALGWTRVTWRQRHDGIEVFGATLHAHVGPDGDLRAVNGALVPIVGPLAVTPVVDGVTAEATAIAHRSGAAHVLERRLVIYDRSLLHGVASAPHLAYAVETETAATQHRDLTFVDALEGRVLDTVPLTTHALTRQVSRGSLEVVVWSEGDPDPIPAGWSGGDAAEVGGWQDLIDGTRESYMFHGSLSRGTYLSFDGSDAPMQTVLWNPDAACPNAQFSPYNYSTRYCRGVTADDVVGHEWGHAYTWFTSGLVYAYQTGALNESYADVWGETVDLLNGRGSDAPGDVRGGGTPCLEDSLRWRIGEDAPGFDGAIRDMWHPECHGDPGRVGSSRYHCDASDGGGVHINSGVPNHLYALLVDGDVYNGVTIDGIGIVKAANILWRANSVYETEVTDFADHADALEQSCADLVGAPLGEPVTTAPSTWTTSSQVITSDDCASVTAAITAVELRDPAPCHATPPVLQPNAPALCAGAGSVESLLSSDFESGLAPWTAGTRAIANPPTYDGGWTHTTSLPSLRAGAAAFAADLWLSQGTYDDETGVAFLDSPVIPTPTDRSRVRVAFTHLVATQPRFDGGNVKVSVNGGPFSLVAAERFVFNAYNVEHLAADPSAPNGSPSPLAGQPGWSGTDGVTGSGSWGESQIDLVDIAEPGDTVQLRFEFATNRYEGIQGWYVDDVRVHTCSDEVQLCPPVPLGACKTAPEGQSQLTVQQKWLTPGTGRLQWSWKKGEEVLASELGDPRTNSRFGLCIWDGRGGVPTLVASMHVANGAGWSHKGEGRFDFKDKRGSQQGVTRLALKAGANRKASTALQAKGFFLELPDPAPFVRFAIDPDVTVQLVSSDGTCWTSTFTPGDFKKNVLTKAQASHKGP